MCQVQAFRCGFLLAKHSGNQGIIHHKFFDFFLRKRLWKHFCGVFVDDLQNLLSCKFIITCLSAVVSSLIADNCVDATLIWSEESKLYPVDLTREKSRDLVSIWPGVVFLPSQLFIISCCPPDKQVLSRFERMHGGLHTYELRTCPITVRNLMKYLGKSI